MINKKRYSAKSRKSKKTAEGKLILKKEGYGFVVTDDDCEDIFVPARYTREAFNGDRVRVEIWSGYKGKREGRIIKILERAHTRLTGRFEQAGRIGRFIPCDPKLFQEIRIDKPHKGSAKDGDLITIEITRFPQQGVPGLGKVLEVLGTAGDPSLDDEIVIRKYNLPTGFPLQVLKEAQRVPGKVLEKELAGRLDLRDRKIITIDGETARDFDDAVSIEKKTDGRYVLGVHIADVGHYVLPGSQLDKEAYTRSTSVYFPGRVIPMLPFELSHEICSLKPQENRLTLSAFITFDAKGNRLDHEFHETVIDSKERMTYRQVKKILEDRDPELRERYSLILPDLEVMRELSEILTAKRRERGSIDFDLPEPEIILDITGEPQDIIKRERNLAHRLIEEFMLAANEAVAEYLKGKQVPLLYRIHDKPDQDKFSDLREFIKELGFSLDTKGEVSPKSLQILLESVRNLPEEHLVTISVLRTMKLAVYSPDNAGHFGLAAENYCHFTSPIRRYPDLVIHRILREVIRGKMTETRKEALKGSLPEIGKNSSTSERNAEQAERECVAMKKILFMQDKVGKYFKGIISGVTKFGIFVELEDIYVEGLVHISMLKNDNYRYLEKSHSLVGQHTGNRFRLADKVKVKVSEVSRDKQEIDFELVG
ncbi:MAG: ribonuclease R [bacterium]